MQNWPVGSAWPPIPVGVYNTLEHPTFGDPNPGDSNFAEDVDQRPVTHKSTASKLTLLVHEIPSAYGHLVVGDHGLWQSSGCLVDARSAFICQTPPVARMAGRPTASFIRSRRSNRGGFPLTLTSLYPSGTNNSPDEPGGIVTSMFRALPARDHVLPILPDVDRYVADT